MAITNNSKGIRGFNMRGNGDAVDGIVPQMTRHLAPGESADFDLADPGNPVYRAWQDVGEVDFGGALEEPKPRRGRPPADPA